MRYDPIQQVVREGRKLVLLRELGHVDGLDDIDTIAGPFAAATAKLAAFAEMDVSTFIAALPRHATPLATIRGAGEARSAM